MSKKMITAASPPAFGLFKDEEADWDFHRTLELMGQKAAEIGECLYAARRIHETDDPGVRSLYKYSVTLPGDVFKLFYCGALSAEHRETGLPGIKPA